MRRLVSFRKAIPEGYFPKLDSIVASRGWPGRAADAVPSDVNRQNDQVRFDIDDLERWRDRIYAAIHSGSVILVSTKINNLIIFLSHINYLSHSLSHKIYF